MQYIDKIELFLMFCMLLYKDLYTDVSVLAYCLLTTVIKIDRDVSIDENLLSRCHSPIKTLIINLLICVIDQIKAQWSVCNFGFNYVMDRTGDEVLAFAVFPVFQLVPGH